MIKLRTDYAELVDMLTDEEAGVLLRALMQYVEMGHVEADVAHRMSMATNILFGIIRRDQERETE